MKEEINTFKKINKKKITLFVIIILMIVPFVFAAFPQFVKDLFNPTGLKDIGVVGNTEHLNWTVYDPDGDLASCWYEYNDGTSLVNTTIACYETPNALRELYSGTKDCAIGLTDDASAVIMQTFTVGGSDRIDGNFNLGIISWYLDLGTTDVNISLWSVTASDPVGTGTPNLPLYSETFSLGDLAEGWTNFTLSTPQALVNGTQYAISINEIGNGGGLLCRDSSGTYVHGSRFNYKTPDTDDFNFMLYNATESRYNSTEFTLSQSTNLTFYSNDTSGNVNSSFLDWDYRILVNSETYNSSTYETSNEPFKIDVTANSSLTAAKLIYNGTSYSGSKSGNIWERTIDLPIGIGTKNFNWNFTYNGQQISAPSHTQTISAINLALCNGTYTVPYINFTFKDEETGTYINASVDLADWTYYLGGGTVTKSLLYTNTTHNLNYAFCFSPSDKTLHNTLTLQYSDTGYPQRIYVSNDDLTNSTTNKILYLLSSADGIYSSLQILDAASNNPVEGAIVVVERQFSGEWTTIGEDETDASGLVTFWLNPDYEHRFTITKTGYGSVQETIRPSQSTYTIFLGTQANVTIPEYRYKNILFRTYPGAGRLNPNTDYVFGINLTASDGNLLNCSIVIKNLTLDTVASAYECGAYGENLSVTYNTGTNAKLFGYYYIDIGDGMELLKANDAWFIESINITSTRSGILDLLDEIKNMPDWGDTHNRQEFSRIVFFFFVMICLIGLYTYFAGLGMSLGVDLLIIWFFMFLGAVSGMIFIEGLSPFPWFNQYGIFLIFSLFVLGFILNVFRRETT